MSNLDNQKQKLLNDDKNIDLVSIPSQEETQDYREYGYKWVIVLLYILPNIANAAMWISCAPIATSIKTTYGIQDLYVDSASFTFMISYIIVNFPANWIIDDYGLRKGMFLGAILTAIGSIIRVFVNYNFMWVIVGQTIAGFGQPFILNAPAKVATFWFKQENRPIMTAILSLINPVGVGIGFLIPTAFVDNITKESQIPLGETQIYNLMFWQAIMFTIMCIPALIFFKDKPETPPSKGAEADKTPTMQGFKILFTNKNSILLIISFSCMLGNFNTLATLINIYIIPFNFTEDDAGLMGALVILLGLVGGAIASLYVEKSRKYKLTIITCSFLGLLSNLGFLGALYTQELWVCIIAACLVGFTNTPLIPLSLDFGCEITFPLGEAISTGFMMAGGNLVGVIYILVINLVISNSDEDMTQPQVLVSSLIGVGILSVSFICNIFLKQDLKRIENEDQKKNSLKSSKIEQEDQQ